ncbi:MAG: DNA polymerase I [Alloprevotella sp.]|nr:DNA polymerase I [Alloprevotella sp.]
MEKIYLLDAYALIYRAYYALIRSPRINSKGENTSAIFGFVNTLEDLLRKEAPEYIAVAFDPAGPTFRHDAYPEYKAQREATPEDIKRSVPIIKDIIRAYRIPLIEVPGYEADDVIGTLARRSEEAGLEVCMLTPDKDYAQLVSTHITMCRPGHAGGGLERLGPKEVCEKYGIESPTQVIDLLALMGDTADNIPGCPGVGEKTAVKLIGQFGSVEGLIDGVDELKGALKKKVEDNVEKIRFSKFLTTIKTDVPLPFDLATMRRQEMDREALRSIFEALEFRQLASRIFGEATSGSGSASRENGTTSAHKKSKQQAAQDAPNMPSLFPEFAAEGQENIFESRFERLNSVSHNYHLVDNLESMRALCEKILTHEKVAYDSETTSTDIMTAEMVGMSFAVEGGEAWYVPVVSRETDGVREILEIFRPFFENEKILKVGQNLKFDLNILARYGMELRPPMFDTMLAHYIIQPELRHNLDYLAEIYLHYQTIHIDELIGPKGRGQKSMADLAPADVVDYACEDADVAMRLMPLLEKELRDNAALNLFQQIEMPLMPVLARMERNGMRLDTAALAQSSEELRAQAVAVEEHIYELAGHPFTIASPKQVGDVLFGELKLSDKVRKTKSGQYSTSEEVLESVKHKHPIVEDILKYRRLKKLLSTYIDALPQLLSPADGRLHSSFNQSVTATGRLSSSNPNLQNIPVRWEDGREIRRAFVPEEGGVFFSADYSQIELRIMAHLSGDESLIRDFKDGRDIHAATAARIFKKPIEDISRDERRKAKTANFGIIYGISAFGLAERMGVSRTEAKDLIENYFATYPGVKAYIEQSVNLARELGYIETLFGRRRYLPDIHSRNAVVRGYAERNAVNAPIQGTAADIIKVAMIRIDKRLQQEGFHAKMTLQVHDELNFTCPADELPRLRAMVIEEMEGACPMAVPLLADCGAGANWLEAH